MANPRLEYWTIANGETISDAIDKQHLDLLGTTLPTLTGANISFTTSPTLAGTYDVLTWEGAVVTFAKAAGNAINWDPLKFAGRRFIRIVSDSAEGAKRTFTPIFRDFN